jgi:hypothetical protein
MEEIRVQYRICTLKNTTDVLKITKLIASPTVFVKPPVPSETKFCSFPWFSWILIPLGLYNLFPKHSLTATGGGKQRDKMDVDPISSPPTAKKTSNAPSERQKPSKTPSGKVLAKQNQKRTLWKNAFDNPFRVSWYDHSPFGFFFLLFIGLLCIVATLRMLF